MYKKDYSAIHVEIKIPHKTTNDEELDAEIRAAHQKVVTAIQEAVASVPFPEGTKSKTTETERSIREDLVWEVVKHALPYWLCFGMAFIAGIFVTSLYNHRPAAIPVIISIVVLARVFHYLQETIAYEFIKGKRSDQ